MTLFKAVRHAQASSQRPALILRSAVSSAKAYLLARLYCEQPRPILIITSDAPQRDQLEADLHCFLDTLPHVAASSDDVPYHIVLRYDHQAQGPVGSVAYQQYRASQTFQPLLRLAAADPVVVVAAAPSLRYGVMPLDDVCQSSLSIKTGHFFAFSDLGATLDHYGYRRVPLVETAGEFSLRGDILDVFSPGQRFPWRIEFFGDEVETIRTFEIQSQISLTALQNIVIDPMHPLGRQVSDHSGFVRLQDYLRQQNWSQTLVHSGMARWPLQPPVAWPWGLDTFFYDRPQNLLDYIPETGLLCRVHAHEVSAVLRQRAASDEIGVGEVRAPLPETHLVDPEVIINRLDMHTDVELTTYESPESSTPVTTLRSRGVPQFFGMLDQVVEQIKKWQGEGFCTLILCRFALGAQRVQSILATYDLGSRLLAACSDSLVDETLHPGDIVLSVGELSQGFVLPGFRLVVLRESDIFGDKLRETSRAPKSRRSIIDFGSLQLGDRVVHVDYGVGRYRGMTFLSVGQDDGEFMELEYADGATLYVPAYRLSVVQKYSSGGENDTERLDRLGNAAWMRTKERVRESLLAMAESLVQLHASRQQNEGHAFAPQGPLHQDFDSQFEYVETEDQLRAIQDVIADMEQPQPMERLVCGDVGYGKTEVAMRAAFKAIYDGKQVAVLVPTTVLAQQHYETFQRRFATYPVRIGVLSRMRSRKEQQQVLADMERGTVDIVIGTHRLLQKDVTFKSLGLLVVDEEHRFGVRHKERIKSLSTQVDVLMLSATPIPRSLHMTLVGLRHVSLIETPPEGRSAIRTMIMPFSESIVGQAVRHELERGGQIFFVHNHIDTLPAMQQMLTRLIPECRIGIAHGQMPERELEKIMLHFLEREFDLLLCTTIIESGLDIPSVNTMIINHAERFGLAQLYQLRGRVGRGTRQAYAYLLIPGDLLLSDVARKRIEAIEEFSELGSGFQLAGRDLEIRGAGNLLGSQQSGHIASVGFDLYCQMLSEAIRTMQGETVPVQVDPELRLEIQGHIPPDYVENEAQRLDFYRRLATVESEVTLEVLHQECRDRFGALPVAVERLFEVVTCKLLARRLGIERIDYQRGFIRLTFHPQTLVRSDTLLSWLDADVPGYQFQSDHIIRFPLTGSTSEARLLRLKKLLQQLWASVSIYSS